MTTISMLESKIKRLRTEIQSLETKHAKSIESESKSMIKINKANETIKRTKSDATKNSKYREIDREQKNIASEKAKQSKYAKSLTTKNINLNIAISELSKLQIKEQNTILKEQENNLLAIQAHQHNQIQEMSKQSTDEFPNKEYDVFISHSADDKDEYVSQLAISLKEADISIWYDSDSIGWGQSIRQSIDKGLSNSRYGIVVISPSFIEKYWTNYELDGILSKESSTGRQMILPIWHNVTADQVKKYSQSLSGKLALNSAVNTIDDITDNLKKLLK